MWVRGLKPYRLYQLIAFITSHPMWVRGLKRKEAEGDILNISRTLCGCVD